jgi:predicted nucleic acid-binding protein
VIVLDTNVVSEPTRLRPDPIVMHWLDRQARETLYLTSTSLAELLVGVETMPVGRRRQGLAADLNSLLERFFGPRILPFEQQAAVVYAQLVSRARANGHVRSVADAQIAAIAEVHGFLLATRDVAPFAAAGVRLINPWLP